MPRDGSTSSQLPTIPTEFRIFTIFGIPVFVSVFLVIYFVYELSTREQSIARQTRHGDFPDYGKAGIIALTCTVGFVVLFATVLLHEFGHCAGAKLVGGRVERILLWPLGGLAFCSSGGGHWKNLVVALAGPLTHAPQYAFWWLAHRGATSMAKSVFLIDVCKHAMGLQISLAIFNLLVPVYPLDCSRVIMACCGILGFSTSCTAALMVLVSAGCICVLLVNMFHPFGIPFLPGGYHPMTLLLVAWLAYQTYQLGNSVARSELKAHPLFRDADSAAMERQSLVGARSRD